MKSFMKNYIASTTIYLKEEKIFYHQIRWKYLNYETFAFSISETEKIF